MIKITTEQLRKIVPFAPKNVDVFVDYLNKFMEQYGINTKQRVAMFVSQLAHESGSFRYTKEIASGKAYEGRLDLGNVIEGDGVKYKGRALLQITGRANYKECGVALNEDLQKHPELLECPKYAVQASAWWWQKHGVNEIADTGNVTLVTKRINGGSNGLAARKEFYERAIKVLTT